MGQGASVNAIHKEMKSTPLSTSDESLWASLRAGSEPAFAALYSRYFQFLFSYGRRITEREDEIVNDAIQDLFLDLWRTRHELGQAETVKFYLLRSLRRKIHRKVKSNAHLGECIENIDEGLHPAEDSAETFITNNEDFHIQSERLALWLNRLPPRQNEALVLHYFHNMSYRQIAAILEIKEQTARNLVQKALTLIRRDVM